MLTSLDLLIIVFMALGAATLLSLGLMFLLRNKKAKKVCFYVTSALGISMSWVGFRIGFGGMFPIQMALGIATALVCVGAIVFESVRKGNDGAFLVSRILSASALVIGFFNAIL